MVMGMIGVDPALRYNMDTSDADRFAEAIRRLRRAFPGGVRTFFDGLGTDLVSAIRADYETLPLAGNPQPMRYTGAYGRALRHEVFEGGRRNAGVQVGFDASLNPRLPVYWRTMETGSVPMRAPMEAIASWAAARGISDPRIVRNAIARRGIRPQRLLQRYFTSAGTGQPGALTDRSNQLLANRLEQFLRDWRGHFTPSQIRRIRLSSATPL